MDSETQYVALSNIIDPFNNEYTEYDELEVKICAIYKRMDD